MTNEIETILKNDCSCKEKWTFGVVHLKGKPCYLPPHPSHLNELLQQVNHDHEILVNTILDTHKSQLKDLYDDLEGEKVKDVNGKEGKYYRKEWNLALNLAQEKIKKLIK